MDRISGVEAKAWKKDTAKLCEHKQKLRSGGMCPYVYQDGLGDVTSVAEAEVPSVRHGNANER